MQEQKKRLNLYRRIL